MLYLLLLQYVLWLAGRCDLINYRVDLVVGTWIQFIFPFFKIRCYHWIDLLDEVSRAVSVPSCYYTGIKWCFPGEYVMHSTRVTFVVMNWGITNCAYRLMMRFFDILHGLFWLGPPIPYGKVANRRTASRSSWEHAPGYFNWIWCLYSESFFALIFIRYMWYCMLEIMIWYDSDRCKVVRNLYVGDEFF